MGIFTRKKQYLHKALPEGISNTSTPASQDGCGSVDELCSSTHLVSPTSNQMVPLPVSTSSYISKPWSKTALGPLLSKATSSVRSQSLSKTPSKPLKYQVRSMTRADDRSEILETIVDNVEYPEIEEGTKDTDLEECSKNADLGGSSTDADVVPPFYKTVAETPKPKASNNKPVPSTAPKPLPYCKPQLKPCCKRMPQKPAQKHARSNIPPVPVKSSRSVNSTISRSGYPAKSSRSGSMALPARSLKTPNGGNPAAVFCCGAEAFSNCPPRRVEFQGYHRPELQDVGVSASLRLDPGDPVLAESTASLHSATIKSHHSQRSNAGKSGTSLANDHDVGDESYEDYENEDQLEYKPSPTCQVQCCCASCCPPPDTCNFFRMPPLPPCQYAAQQYRPCCGCCGDSGPGMTTPECLCRCQCRRPCEVEPKCPYPRQCRRPYEVELEYPCPCRCRRLCECEIGYPRSCSGSEGNRCCRPKSRELRGGILTTGCFCNRKNGLQDDCPRTGCQGAPPCMTQPNPTCKNQQFSQGKHLEEKWEKKEKTETKVCYCTTYQSAYGTKARCGPCCTVQVTKIKELTTKSSEIRRHSTSNTSKPSFSSSISCHSTASASPQQLQQQRCHIGDHSDHCPSGCMDWCNCGSRIDRQVTCHTPPRIVPNIPQLSSGFAIPCVNPLIGIPCHTNNCNAETGCETNGNG